MDDERYTRTVIFLTNELTRPLRDYDAETLMGAEVSVSLRGAALVEGVVAFAKVVDGGRRLQVAIESGGRRCPACGEVYTSAQALLALRPLRRLQALMTLPDTQVYRGIPGWVKVCSDPLACRGRAAERAAAAG